MIFVAGWAVPLGGWVQVPPLNHGGGNTGIYLNLMYPKHLLPNTSIVMT